MSLASAVHPTHRAVGPYAWYVLAMLCLVNVFASMDRYAFFILIPPIKREFMASDTAIGLVSGLSFVLFYALFGIPVANWIDRGSRRLILSVSMAMWSLATLLGGFAGSMFQLGLVRAGLGAGEAGATPASNSLIADYFDKVNRPVAVAVFQAGMGLSAVLAVPMVGLVAAEYGWRAALFTMGVPGVLLSVLVYLTVKEPARGAMDETTHVPIGERGLAKRLRALFARRDFAFLTASHVAVGVAAGVLPVWLPTYFVRAYEIGLPAVGAVMGLLNGIVMLISFAAAGVLTAWLVRKRGDHWTAALPAIAGLAGAPLLVAALAGGSFNLSIGIAAVYYTMQFATRPGAFTLSIELVTPESRGLSTAICVVGGSVIGAGLGPLIVGAISDALTPTMGDVQALRVALILIVPPSMALAGLFFWGVTRQMRRNGRVDYAGQPVRVSE